MKKPSKPAREYISPSDLTFGLSTCTRCLWIKYWYKLSAPLQMPLVGTLSSLQEERFHNADMPTIHASLRPGVVTKWGEFVKSKPLQVNGIDTRWRILGKYDLVSTNVDGSIGLIDCKVSDSSRDSGQAGTNVNQLTSQQLTDLGRGPVFYDCLVEVTLVALAAPLNA